MTTSFGSLVGAASLLVALVLAAAGLAKARASTEFAAQILDYRVVPERITPILARIISSAELASSAMLIVGVTASGSLRQAGAGLAAALFTVFLVALVRAQTGGRSIACACFGGDGELETIGPHSLARTGLLLLLAVLAIFPAHLGRAFDVVSLAMILAALVAVISESARLFGPLRQTTKIIVDQLTVTTTPRDGEASL
jgi:hypothetical protein